LYALHRLGATRSRCDLSAAIDLSRRDGPPTRSLRNSLKKARKNNVTVVKSNDYYPPFWDILSEKLSGRHDAVPVHTLDEIQDLAERFPENIQLVTGLRSSEVIAGTLLFHTAQTVHAQYGATNSHGADAGALDLVIETSIRDGARQKKRFFDFGNSNEQDGAVLNAGLHQFKVKFGASGVAHEFYSLQLGTA
jgi:hypothetical protein